MIITKTICDLCRGEDKVEPHCIHVKFTTEQTEGRSIQLYAQKSKLDLCPACYHRYVNSLPLVGSGAQGFNEYRWDKHTQ